MSDVPSSEIRDALRQWLRESLTLLAHQPLTMIELPEVRLNPDDDGWSVEGYSQVPDYFRLVRSAGEVLEALPGLSEITEILNRSESTFEAFFTDGLGNRVTGDDTLEHLFGHFLEPFLLAYLNRADWQSSNQSAIEETAFQRTLQDLLDLVVAPHSVWITASMELRNLATDLERFDLETGVSIRSATEEERKASVRRMVVERDFHAEVPRAFLEVRRSITELGVRWGWQLVNRIQSESRHARDTALLVLRLALPHPVRWYRTTYEVSNPCLALYSRESSYPAALFDPGGPRYVITAQVADDVRALWKPAKDVLGRADDTPVLRVALTRFEDSYRRQRVEDKLVDYWVALEGLFLTKDEKTEIMYRASLRIARFLGSTPDERRELRRLVKDSYNLRSSVVHGSRLGQAQRDKLIQTEARTGKLLRRALRRCLERAAAPNPIDIDDDLLS